MRLRDHCSKKYWIGAVPGLAVNLPRSAPEFSSTVRRSFNTRLRKAVTPAGRNFLLTSTVPNDSRTVEADASAVRDGAHGTVHTIGRGRGVGALGCGMDMPIASHG